MKKTYLFSLREDEHREVFLLEPSGIMQIESRLGEDDYRLYNRFVNSYGNRKSIFDFLRNAYHQAQADLYEKNLSLVKRFSSLFLPYVPPIDSMGNFLDVGCNTGSLLKKLSRSWKKYGVEINTDAYEEAKKDIDATIYNVTLENLETEIKFDFVRASHVIEHVQDHEKFVQQLFHIMKPGAHALIYTPNTRSLSFLLFRKHWSQFYDKTHVHLFNLGNIKDLFNSNGFQTVDAGTYYMGTTASSLVNLLGLNYDSISSKLLFYPLFIFFSLFSFLVNALNLGGAMYIYVKKQSHQ